MLKFFCTFAAVSGQEYLSKMWIWGEGVPSSGKPHFDTSLSDQYPDHGIIHLIGNDIRMEIILVKRPPENRYTAPSFCGALLPAAIADFYDSNMFSLQKLKYMSVDVVTGSYYTKACKCYVNVMVSMGLTRINGVLVSDIEEFCANQRRLTGIVSLNAVPMHGITASLGEINEEQSALLATADTVLDEIMFDSFIDMI